MRFQEEGQEARQEVYEAAREFMLFATACAAAIVLLTAVLTHLLLSIHGK